MLHPLSTYTETERMPTWALAVEATTPGQVQPEKDNVRTVHHQSDASDAQIINEPIHAKTTVPFENHDKDECATCSDRNKVICGPAHTLSHAHLNQENTHQTVSFPLFSDKQTSCKTRCSEMRSRRSKRDWWTDPKLKPRHHGKNKSMELPCITC